MVLPQTNVAKAFEVQMDASDFAIVAVLMQEEHPIAYESRKLNKAERSYTVQEKEMTTVVHCLRTWRHHLLGSHFIVKTDNVATGYFQSQKKSPKQPRWQDSLAEFDFNFEYKPGKANQVANALTRRAELEALSQPEGILLDLIKEGLKHDKVAQASIKAAESEGQKSFEWKMVYYSTRTTNDYMSQTALI